MGERVCAALVPLPKSLVRAIYLSMGPALVLGRGLAGVTA